ncbi:ATP-binding protein [Salisaeta longa]|uniref:ATP-binding protein n=1 Tax=Salisaeta longa TaxID=503170 RepID=UPI0003B44AEE|nr:ATP-binding protein [Salisaeta longa]
MSQGGEHTKDHDIVPAHLAVKAMRDNGYKNAAYAIAELMDNAIQAQASQVELLCGEREVQLKKKKSSRIHQIAVLDNGTGMDERVLRLALQFGNGTYLDPEDQDGIGKFGMGLPSSSMSQCRRVDVWSWQDGIDSAIYTYLDLDAVLDREMKEVPVPEPKSIPELWQQVGNSFGKSGTLVVWSQLDRVMWKTARAIIRNSEMLIGRMYRRFLANDRVQIRMHSFDLDKPQKGGGIEKYAQPNDPLYLMSTTSCPYEEEPMFERWGEPHKFEIYHKGEIHPVTITFSFAKEEARRGHNPGSKPHGRHAAKNVGVSIVRAGRELELDQSWVVQYDPTERWWGVEVEFPPALDDLFGVSNNKQTARNFHELDAEALKQDSESITELKERLEEENDPAGPLLELSDSIDRNLKTIRKLLKAQTKGSQGGQERHQDIEAEEQATAETRKRQKEGYQGESDQEETLPDEEQEKELEEELRESGMTQEAAQGIAAFTVNRGLKYTFAETALEARSQLFSITPRAGKIIIKLNTTHPGYENLIEVLENVDGDEDADALRDRLRRARKGLRLLLLAWARYEDEQRGDQRERAQDIRYEWGKIARQFMREMD